MSDLIICLLSTCAVMVVIILMIICSILEDLKGILKRGITIKIEDNTTLHIVERDSTLNIEADKVESE